MNKNNLVKIIGRELSILTDFVNGFADSDDIHPMEVDLALSKAKDIYNELVLLKGVKLASELSIPELVELPKGIIDSKKTHKQDGVEEPMLKQEKSIIPVEDAVLELINESQIAVELNKEPLSAEPIEPKEEEILLIESVHIEQSEPINSIIVEENIPEFKEELANEPKLPEGIVEIKPKKGVQKVDNKEYNVKSETIADKFPKESFSINDKLAGYKNNNDLASILKGTPITDLKKAIKLNDRVWFTNELFNKNGATFEKAVERVNASLDLDSALKYLFENFTWNQESQSTISFLELVFRRFPSK